MKNKNFYFKRKTFRRENKMGKVFSTHSVCRGIWIWWMMEWTCLPCPSSTGVATYITKFVPLRYILVLSWLKGSSSKIAVYPQHKSPIPDGLNVLLFHFNSLFRLALLICLLVIHDKLCIWRATYWITRWTCVWKWVDLSRVWISKQFSFTSSYSEDQRREILMKNRFMIILAYCLSLPLCLMLRKTRLHYLRKCKY